MLTDLSLTELDLDYRYQTDPLPPGVFPTGNPDSFVLALPTGNEDVAIETNTQHSRWYYNDRVDLPYVEQEDFRAAAQHLENLRLERSSRALACLGMPHLT